MRGTRDMHHRRKFEGGREWLQVALDAGGIGVWDDDFTGNLRCSERARDLLGLGVSKKTGLAKFLEPAAAEDRVRLRDCFRSAMSPPGPHEFDIEYRICQGNEAVRWVNVRGQCLFAGRGAARKPVRITGTVADVTERKGAETALRQNQARLAGVIASAMDAIITVDEDHRVVLFNAAAEAMFRCKASEVLGEPIERFIPESYRRAHEGHMRRFGQTGTTNRAMGGLDALTAVAADGTEFQIEASISQMETDGRKLFTVIMRDVTERQQEMRGRQDAINRQPDVLSTFIEHAPAGLAMFDRKMRYVAVSQRWCKDYGLERDEILGKSHFQIFPNLSESWKEIYRRALQGEVLKSENDYLATPDGKGHWVRWEIRPWGHSDEKNSGVILFAEDVTGHRVLERQFLQAQKMEAVGQLAGGVAHDFNNLLMVMKSYGRLIGDSAPNTKIRKYAEKIAEAAEKAAAVTKQLLAFSRKQAQELSLLDINLVVSQFCSMLPNLIGEEIDLVVVPSPEPVFAKADRAQLEQERNGASVPPGEYVVLTVIDTGCGMDEETKAHVFEPFFTTKEVGKGSGLGLPMVYGMVKQSNGFIWLDSQLGIGTSFKIYLPRIRDGASDQTAEVIPGIDEEGHETILLAEDNESLREVIAEYLTSKGYEVLLAKDGIEALQIAETRKEPIHLLLSDIVMPRMRGPELVRRLSGIHTEARAMYMSGYADLAIEGKSLRDAIVVAKPVDLAALARKIRQALLE